jgi:hypothetical protein
MKSFQLLLLSVPATLGMQLDAKEVADKLKQQNLM